MSGERSTSLTASQSCSGFVCKRALAKTDRFIQRFCQLHRVGSHCLESIPVPVLYFCKFIWEFAMADPADCKHLRTQLIAKDADAQYVECLDCGAILEADELGPDKSGFDASLSDA